MKLKTSSHWVVGCTALSMVLTAACGKKKSSDTTDSSGATGTVSAGTAGVGAESTDGTLSVAGTLALTTGSSLADEAPNAILVFNLSQGQVIGSPTSVDVAADGSFTVPVTKTDSNVEFLKAQMALDPSARDWDAIATAGAKVTGEPLTAAYLKAMSEAEIQKGVARLAKRLSAAGNISLIVAYTKSASGDKVAEADSFRFIGMPTAEGQTMDGIPVGDLKGSISFGQVTGTGSDVTTQLAAGDAMNLSAAAIEHFAGAGKALKMVKNAYMNSTWQVQPFFVWNGGQHPADIIGADSDPSKLAYQGYGFYVSAQGADNLTYDDLCGAKEITFTAPAAIDLLNNPGTSNTGTTSVTSFSNHGATKSTQGDSKICQGGYYYARPDMDSSGTIQDIMLNYGTGGSIETSPKGLWKLAVAGTDEGWFDLNLVQPIDEQKHANVFVPVANFTKTGSNITAVTVKLYHQKKSGELEQVKDLAAVKALASQIEASISRKSDNGESRAEMTVNDDGTLTAAFDGKQMNDDGDGTTPVNPAVAASDVNSFSFYYQIGGSNFRTQWW